MYTVNRASVGWLPRTVLRLLVLSMKIRSPAVLEFVTLPCLRIVNHLIQPDPPTSKKHKVTPVHQQETPAWTQMAGIVIVRCTLGFIIQLAACQRLMLILV